MHNSPMYVWAARLWLAAGLLAGVLVGMAALPSGDYAFNTAYGESTIAITLSPSRIFSPTGCFTLHWQMDGIQTVRLNFQDTVGEATQTLCDQRTGGLSPPRSTYQFDVAFPDGAQARYFVPLHYTSRLPGYELAWVAVGLLAFAGTYALVEPLLATLTRLPSWTIPYGRWRRWISAALVGIFPYGLVAFAALSYISVLIWGFVPVAALWWLLLGCIIVSGGLVLWLSPAIVDPPALRLDFFWPFLVLLPPLIAQMISLEAALLFDGANHTSIVYAVQNAGIPPENVWLAGTPNLLYWDYHMLLGTLAWAFNITPPQGYLILHGLVIVATVYWAAQLTAESSLLPAWDWRGSLRVLFVLFGAGLSGLGFLLANAVQGNGLFLFPMPFHHSYHLSLALQRFTGFQLGALFTLIGFTAIARLYRYGLSASGLFLLGVAVTGCVAYHATSGLFLLVCLPLAYGVSVLLSHLQPAPNGVQPLAQWQALRAFFVARWRTIALAAIVGSGIVLPVLAYILAVTTGNRESIAWNPAILLVLHISLPSGVYLWLGWQRITQVQQRLMGFWLAVGLVGMFAAILLDLIGQNGKFVLLASVALNLVALYGLEAWLTDARNARRFLARLGVALAFVNTLLLVVTQNLLPSGINSLFLRGFSANHTAMFQPNHVSNPLCTDARDTLPLEAIIVQPLVSVWDSAVYLCQRSVYLASDSVITEPAPEYRLREQWVRMLYLPSSTPAERQMALTAIRRDFDIQGRPLYLQVPSSMAPVRQVAQENDATLQYEDDDWALFALPPL